MLRIHMTVRFQFRDKKIIVAARPTGLFTF